MTLSPRAQKARGAKPNPRTQCFQIIDYPDATTLAISPVRTQETRHVSTQPPVPRNQPRSCGGGVWSAMSIRQAARATAPETAHIRQNPTASLQSKIDRVRHARAQIAQQITIGEEWMLPLLKRFNTELARLEETQDLLLQATEIANHAAPHRAA